MFAQCAEDNVERVQVDKYFTSGLKTDQFLEILHRRAVRRVALSVISGRSGSSYLAAILRGCGFGVGKELFNQGAPERLSNIAEPNRFDVFLEHKLLRWTKNGVLYFQVTPARLRGLLTLVPGEAWRAADATVSLIYRRDIFSQAISKYNASSTGMWHTTKTPQAPRAVNVDPRSPEAVAALIASEQRGIRIAQEHFGVETPFILYYEDIVAAPYESALALLRHHGASQDCEAALTASIADSQLPKKIVRDEFAAQYKAMRDAIPAFDEWLAKRMALGAHPTIAKEMRNALLKAPPG
jgi:LPS sulfotransferase NodH